MAQREQSRRVPSPLNLSPRSPPPLLYDLPTPFSSSSPSSSFPAPRSPRSPPRTPRGRAQGPLSPTTQTFSSLGPRSSVLQPIPLPHQQAPSHSKHHQQNVYGVQSPNRSTSGTPTQELEVFAALCRAWYFQQDPEADAKIQETLRTIPASQRASYTRLQSHIRSSYHTALALRKASEFHAHITSTRPGQSLSPLNRQNFTSATAKQERLQRFQKLVDTWATSGNVGTKPFFDGLFAVLRLQALPENLGGAGKHRMEWEIDDAVFQESAGKEFMLEAIDVLKGVLGFEDSIQDQRDEAIQPSSKTGPTLRPDNASLSTSRTPPPLPSRPNPNSKGRPTLPTITSGSTIDTSGTSRVSGISNIEQPQPSATLLANDEGDTFADPIQGHSPTTTASRRRAASSTSVPPIPPRIKKNAVSNPDATSKEWETENSTQSNRNRSASDPFSDTHGHFTFGRGHAHVKSKGQSSSGDVLEATDSSPFSTLITTGGSSVGTTTTGSDSLLAERDHRKPSQKHSLLPSEDFELEATKLPLQSAPTADALSPESDQEDDTLLGGSHLINSGMKPNPEKRSVIGFVNKKRRTSEPMGLGLLGTDPAGQSVTPTTDNLDVTTASTLTAAASALSRNLSMPGELGFLERPYLRTWVAPPYLGNPEIAKLLAIFPTPISRGAVPRFKVTAASKAAKRKSRRREADTEAQLQEAVEDDNDSPRETVRHGTGRIWIGTQERHEGWGGSLWERFIGWWRKLFC